MRAGKSYRFVVLGLAGGILACAGCEPPTENKVAIKRSVVIWHWMADKHDVLASLARDYANETGVHVKWQLFTPTDVYTDHVKAASREGRLPDVFGLLAEKHILASFIRAGYVCDLSAEMSADGAAWSERFYPTVLSHNEFGEANEYGIEPGIYGIPIDLMTVQMVYNKTLFAKAGLDPENPPKSWADFIACGGKLKEAGIPVFVSGFGELWLADCLATTYAFNVMGEQQVIDTFRGKVPYTDPSWVKVLSLFKEMADEGLWYTDITRLNNKRAEQIFADGGAAMALNGSWCVNVYTEMNPSLEFGVFPPPMVSEDQPMRVWGSAGASFLVNRASECRADAIAFLKWLTDTPQQKRLATETSTIPANRVCSESMSPQLAAFARGIESSTHPSRWPIMERGPVIEAFDTGIQSIIDGESSPEEIAAKVQEVKDNGTG